MDYTETTLENENELPNWVTFFISSIDYPVCAERYTRDEFETFLLKLRLFIDKHGDQYNFLNEYYQKGEIICKQAKFLKPINLKKELDLYLENSRFRNRQDIIFRIVHRACHRPYDELNNSIAKFKREVIAFNDFDEAIFALIYLYNLINDRHMQKDDRFYLINFYRKKLKKHIDNIEKP